MPRLEISDLVSSTRDKWGWGTIIDFRRGCLVEDAVRGRFCVENRVHCAYDQGGEAFDVAMSFPMLQ